MCACIPNCEQTRSYCLGLNTSTGKPTKHSPVVFYQVASCVQWRLQGRANPGIARVFLHTVYIWRDQSKRTACISCP